MILLRLYFLGSGHEAKYYSIKGKPYNGDENVYYRSWRPQQNQENTENQENQVEPIIKIRFVFTGPSGMDIIKSAASITKKALKIIPDYIDNSILKCGFNVQDLKFEIAGHSRGAMIAQDVYEELNKKYPDAVFSIAKYDEYGGPFHILKKKNNVRDLSTKPDENNAQGTESSDDTNLLDYSLVVISMDPTVPFRSIAKNKNPKTIIFTTCSHGSCMAVGKAFLKIYKGSDRYGVFIHISKLYYQKNSSEATFSEQVKKFSEEENAYEKLTPGNALDLYQKLAKALGCGSKVYNSNNKNEVVQGILKTKSRILHAVSARRAKAFIDSSIKSKALDAKEWKNYAYRSEHYP